MPMGSIRHGPIFIHCRIFKMPSKEARVVVIGGGMAGLSAAEHLHKNGFNNVTLLEGSNRYCVYVCFLKRQNALTLQ